MTTTVRSTGQTPSLTTRPAWKSLEAHYQTVRHRNLRELFVDDPRRGERFAVEAAGLYLDYSKNRITDETIRLLVQLADDCGLRER
ncbi:MAG: glucose-6-phosphate isomerase, partial [Vicinamibacterales bacterium]